MKQKPEAHSEWPRQETRRDRLCEKDDRLGLAGAGVGAARRTAGGGAVGLGVAVELLDSGGSLADGGNLEILHSDERLTLGVAARTTGLDGLLVGSGVEGDEEQEVRAENSHAGERSEFLTSTLTGIGEPVEVGRGEVGVRGEVDEA